MVTALSHSCRRIRTQVGRAIMDSYREHPSDFDAPAASETTADDVAAAIGTDERRMHVRAYNYWASLLEGRDFPVHRGSGPGECPGLRRHTACFSISPAAAKIPAFPYIGAGDPRRMRPRRRHSNDRRRSEPLAAVASYRPLHADHRQPRARSASRPSSPISAAKTSAIAVS